MSITFTTLAGRYTVADGQVDASPVDIWPGVDAAWDLVALDGQIMTPSMGVYEQPDLEVDEGAVVTLVRSWVMRSGDWIVSEAGEYPEMRGEHVRIGAPATVQVFHLQGQHDQQNHAGGRGAGNSLGYDPHTEIPTHRPGEAEIPEGAVRLTHRTWSNNVDSIMENGLGGEHARQHDFEGEVVWAAAGVAYGQEAIGGPWQAESDITFFEFWMMPDELIIGNGDDPARLESSSSHVTMRDVPPERFVGVYEPWHAAFWSFESRTAGTFEEVKSGFYDNVGESYPDTYGKAMDYIKREDLAVEVFHLQGQHDQQDHGNRGGTAVLDGPLSEPVEMYADAAVDMLVEIGRADRGVVDLTNLTLKMNPYLFKGVPSDGRRSRGEMPQVPEASLPAFHDHLEAEGVTFTNEVIDPASVKSTQTELDATKVGQMIGRVLDGNYTTGHDPWVSNDGYILDGHHRWATMAVLSAAGIPHPPFNVQRVSLPIEELLTLADEFNAQNSITRKTIDMSASTSALAGLDVDEFGITQFHLQGQHDQQTHAGGRATAQTINPADKFGPDSTPAERDQWLPLHAAVKSDRPVEFNHYESAYRVTAADGNQVTAKVFAESDQRDTLASVEWQQRTVDGLNGVVDGYEAAPTDVPPHMIVVTKLPAGLPMEAQGAIAMVRSSGGNIRIRPADSAPLSADFMAENEVVFNASPIGQMAWREYEANAAKIMMPSVNAAGVARYTGAHEYGHTRAGDDNISFITQLYDDMRPLSLSNISPEWKALSQYGKTNPAEAHAEAFADWVMTGGRSDNAATRLYAGWLWERDEALAAAAGATQLRHQWVWCLDTPNGGILVTKAADGVQFHLEHDQKDHGRRGSAIDMSWEQVKDKYPVYASFGMDHAVNELAHVPDGDVVTSQLRYTEEPVDMRSVRFQRYPSSDGRMASAMKAYEQGDPMPPVLLVKRAGELHTVDGHHRLSAQEALGLTTVPAVIAHSLRKDKYAGRASIGYAADELAVQVFHLEGTENDHDQSTHAGGRARQGVSEEFAEAPSTYTDEARAAWAAGAAYLADSENEMPEFWLGLDYMGEDGLPVGRGQVGIDYEATSLEEVTEFRESLPDEVEQGIWMIARAADERRKEAIAEAIAMNEISVEDANERYEWDAKPDRGEWQELPSTLYHATSKLGAIAADGSLKTRREIGGRAVAAGLGGGTDNTISYTDDRQIAEGIARSLHEAHRALNMDPEELVAELEARAGSWWPEVRDSAANIHSVRGVPQTIEEQYNLFRSFTYIRQSREGVLDPLFFNVNPENLRDMDPSEIGIVEVAPAVTSAKGYQVSSLGEWRVPTGRTTEITRFIETEDTGEFSTETADLAVQVFHLQGQHDQQTHAGGRAKTEFEPITAAEARGNSRPVTSEEFQRLAAIGRRQIDELAADTQPIALDENWTEIQQGAFDAAQESWGGATINARTGEFLASDADRYALTVKDPGFETVSIPEGASQAEFEEAMTAAKEKFRPILERRDHYLGVFHDDDLGRIDFDPVTVVDTLDEVETIGAATRAIGGAYNFADGNGYWPPHVDEERAVVASASMGSMGDKTSFKGPAEWKRQAKQLEGAPDAVKTEPKKRTFKDPGQSPT